MDEKKDELTLAKEWIAEAKTCTPESLPAFLKKMADYNHDYSTINRAIAAVGIAAMHAVDRSPNGGITGFQAGYIMWDLIDGWGSFGEGPKEMVRYHHMLYPQYQDHLDNTISTETWEWLQAQAKEKTTQGAANENVIAHWQSIVDGEIPFGYRLEDG